MADEIGINLRADPSSFEAGTKAAAKALDDWEKSAGQSADAVAEKLEEVIRTVVELGTESGKTRADMVSDLGKFGLSADQAERSIEAVWDQMGEGQKAARDVEDAAESFDKVKDSADDAAEGAEKVGDAANDTGGKVSELGDIARDVLEGDFASAAEGAIQSLTALGAFAGIGGALGAVIGEGVGAIVGDWLGQWERASEATKERISSMYEDMLASGRAFVSDQFITERIAEIYDPKNVDDFNRAVEFSNDLGVDRQTIIQAMAGDVDALATAHQGAKDTLAELNDKQEAFIEKNGRESAAIEGQIGAAEIAIEAFNRYAGAQDTAAARAAEAADAIRGVGGDAETSAGKVDGLKRSIDGMPTEKLFKITADTSQADSAVARLSGVRISPLIVDVIYRDPGRFPP